MKRLFSETLETKNTVDIEYPNCPLCKFKLEDRCFECYINTINNLLTCKIVTIYPQNDIYHLHCLAKWVKILRKIRFRSLDETYVIMCPLKNDPIISIEMENYIFGYPPLLLHKNQTEITDICFHFQ